MTTIGERIGPQKDASWYSASLAANRSIAQLFGVTPRDPIAIVVALSVLEIATMGAGHVPARQASRIDR
jgi:hypothetical protein